MAKKLSRKQRKLEKMKDLEKKNGLGKIDVTEENMQSDSVAIQAKPLTFARICGIVVNIIIAVTILFPILVAWIYCLSNYERGLGSILIIVIPFILVIITLFIFTLRKIFKKIWGILLGFAIGTIFISFMLFIIIAAQRNNMYFSLLPLIVLIIIYNIVYGIIKVFAGDISIIFTVPVIYIWAGILLFNRSFDNSPIITYDVTVVKKWYHYDPYEYFVKFDDGDQSLNIKKIEVIEDEYDNYEKGDHIRLLCRNGAFGLQYVESYYEVE